MSVSFHPAAHVLESAQIDVGHKGTSGSFPVTTTPCVPMMLRFTAQYERVSRLLEDLVVSKADGTYNDRLSKIKNKSVLILDDFGLAPLTAEHRRDLLEVLEDRYDKSSTIITSQLPVEHWHEMIGDPTIADAILDRVVHNSHKIHLKGESRRKTKAKDLQLVS